MELFLIPADWIHREIVRKSLLTVYGKNDTLKKDKWFICPLGVFRAPAFVADFSPVAPEVHQRTYHVRLRNLGTTDKKSSHKIRYRKNPREHL